MDRLVVYGHYLSSAVRAVLLVAKELNLKIDFREINFINGEQLKEDYIKINPQHTIPTLDDNGQILWDSTAICTYLIDKYGQDDRLYSKDVYIRARIDQRLYFNCGLLFPLVRQSLISLIFKGQDEFSDDIRQNHTNAMNFLESFFSDNTYLVGNSMTVADLCCITSVMQLELVEPLNSVIYPKICKWVSEMKKLPYFNEIDTIALEKYRRTLPEWREVAKARTKTPKLYT